MRSPGPEAKFRRWPGLWFSRPSCCWRVDTRASGGQLPRLPWGPTGEPVLTCFSVPRRVSSRPRPAELSRMSAAQRLELLEEERARFRELLASPAYRASPLLAIGQQLAQQMQLDGGSQL
ncbi:protein FAM207A [Leptonychotes weddellii]|uniref:Protein FAM207A n=1 Tax=Leptonychotes weddellii TaxID=9713 RepID=A0A7F8PZT7_LEPWE|nr:protein FAM207A [Leptonychotes weddellii]